MTDELTVRAGRFTLPLLRRIFEGPATLRLGAVDRARAAQPAWPRHDCAVRIA